ncbi:methyltransferase domain-containing protein [Micromonospora sp. PLK6-60]|uniref:methyltransferase domain-containing protein n=1 Tax=Micromonospora sp. PLK6-60 TaxID=2873383 RepID=UPI001CA5F5DD|nr:methyltransferase domain-containing protein [Micromonospora sp. PLK6-60]MBY8870422.1 methyltransferase domain-containing protein [Micromonospora sp. PLK6-60]
MTDDDPAEFAAWLRLREAADAAARAPEFVALLRDRPAAGPLAVHDLGCGVGSVVRWLAPQLPGAQRWTLYDRDAALLARAAGTGELRADDGAPVQVRTRRADLTRLTAADLAGAGLITASALLDMLTAEELDRMVDACVGAGCPTLLMVSVTGRVAFTPAEPLDAELAAAFNDHQRRTVDGRRLLGPDAVDAAVAAFDRRGVDVRRRPSPWRLGPDDGELITAWLTGWLAAAGEQRPELAGPARAYARRRLDQIAAGRLRVELGHDDLLVGLG